MIRILWNLMGGTDFLHDGVGDDRAKKQGHHHQHGGEHGEKAQLFGIHRAGGQIRAIGPLHVVGHGSEKERPDKAGEESIQNLDSEGGVLFEEAEDVGEFDLVLFSRST